MITIRAAQVAALRRSMQESFIERLLPHLRKAGKALPDDELRLCARAAIDASARWNLATEVEIYRLAVLHIRLGRDFEQHPPSEAVADVLAQPSLDGASRLASLEQSLR